MKAKDQILIQKSLAGDRRAFETLYREYRNQIYGTLAQRISDRDTVDDLMQNTFLRAYRSLHTFKGNAAFSTWLTQIALNVYRSHLRSQKVRQNWVSQTEDPEAIHNVVRNLTVSDSPDQIVQDRERTELVRRSIQRLPERYRKAMWLRYVMDWSYEEITQALQVPLGTVKTWLCRARRQLKNEFRKLGLQPG
ncbi:MAG: sigma-70 family RNA polymerase sigma factor [Candidatus Latescibacteria bacterium]|jgi:RNA polymerase sigma-70 factor (ECF subfamily)|nr:sigma-70 family RNA polymerase sigma factor [Candidatus Latescibacterota bacterium]